MAKLYQRKFCSLQEAVVLIADRLVRAYQKNYPDPTAALRDARGQLLRALFEGAVRSEGVSFEVGPPEYGPPSIEYDQWVPIDRGTWSHERCDESDHINRLDSIEVHWERDEITYFDSDGYWAECGERKIKLCRADLDREFPARAATAADYAPAEAPVEPAYRTGLAGRPSSRHLVEQEMQRRAKEGILCDTLAAETKALCLWLRQGHPEAPPVTPKTLETSLREQYRVLRRSMKFTQ